MNDEPLAELKYIDSLTNERVVIIDLSLAWNRPFEEKSTVQLVDISSDIHLLVDIYWLEKVRITVQQSGDILYDLLKSSLMERLVK